MCSGAPQAAWLTTLVTLRPLLGVSYPWYQISFLALGSCSTPGRAAAGSKRCEARFFGVRQMCCTPTRRHYQSYGDTRALAPSLELWTRSQSVVSPPTQLIDGFGSQVRPLKSISASRHRLHSSQVLRRPQVTFSVIAGLLVPEQLSRHVLQGGPVGPSQQALQRVRSRL